MASTPQCYSRLKSKVARLTKLDGCGAPITGAGKNSIVTSGFIKVDSKMNMDTGIDFSVRNAWGDYCVNQKDGDVLKSITLQVDFCSVDMDAPGLVAAGAVRSIAQVAASNPVTAGAGSPIGYAVNGSVGTGGWALELWSKVTGVPCGATAVWLYTVFPNIGPAAIMDETYEAATATFSVTADTNAVTGSVWGASGPYATVPHPDIAVTTGEHVVHILTNVQPPSAVCGAVAIT